MEAYNNEQYVAMLEKALEKAKQGKGRSGVLVTIKPNGIDQTAVITHSDDMRAAIDECDKLKQSLIDLRDGNTAG